MAIRLLSELEGVCLGLIRKHEPCTAYHVRQELKASPSSHWQASAGSVYPLLNRLQKEGRIATTADKADGRGRRLLHMTPRGKAALKKWLLTGASPEIISSMTDPIRSRTFFLDVLSATERALFLDKLVAEMEHYLKATNAHLNAASGTDDEYDQLGAKGAAMITEARLEWLRDVRKANMRK